MLGCYPRTPEPAAPRWGPDACSVRTTAQRTIKRSFFFLNLINVGTIRIRTLILESGTILKAWRPSFRDTEFASKPGGYKFNENWKCTIIRDFKGKNLYCQDSDNLPFKTCFKILNSAENLGQCAQKPNRDPSYSYSTLIVDSECGQKFEHMPPLYTLCMWYWYIRYTSRISGIPVPIKTGIPQYRTVQQ